MAVLDHQHVSQSSSSGLLLEKSTDMGVVKFVMSSQSHCMFLSFNTVKFVPMAEKSTTYLTLVRLNVIFIRAV